MYQWIFFFVFLFIMCVAFCPSISHSISQSRIITPLSLQSLNLDDSVLKKHNFCKCRSTIDDQKVHYRCFFQTVQIYTVLTYMFFGSLVRFFGIRKDDGEAWPSYSLVVMIPGLHPSATLRPGSPRVKSERDRVKERLIINFNIRRNPTCEYIKPLLLKIK